ncbi:hypothetical protein PtrSN002B_001807 [Pyrenophora tritici-repentis]|uniref:Uncharacterized protein n=1 Tax=Pyrenophora tritici-repentis TaxID=45151 RepID=A0A2W1FB37_9PLEO|nr:hypothetical protein PtrV1_12324 [Pyrenophora tritici-repentis]KAF7445125.1 hypothetical protein A1F99_101110 [Pyrenophora tritici-repentis]KAF7565393.1 hypothetical protein PtrM4_048270 [Pyrenophora tritici-repentis]KAG9380469.1 hypothetical protein A1F94_009364 [Pyrenophora tritici-repentis]KAI0582659.1 hypothetical protein Alg215_03978 [Pyrenophora tritici-repentis]
MSTALERRIERRIANCEIIWGKRVYDFEVETDDHYYYHILVREDCGTYWGQNFAMTDMYIGEERAWRELDISLQKDADDVLREEREAAAAAKA